MVWYAPGRMVAADAASSPGNLFRYQASAAVPETRRRMIRRMSNQGRRSEAALPALAGIFTGSSAHVRRLGLRVDGRCGLFGGGRCFWCLCLRYIGCYGLPRGGVASGVILSLFWPVFFPGLVAVSSFGVLPAASMPRGSAFECSGGPPLPRRWEMRQQGRGRRAGSGRRHAHRPARSGRI